MQDENKRRFHNWVLVEFDGEKVFLNFATLLQFLVKRLGICFNGLFGIFQRTVRRIELHVELGIFYGQCHLIGGDLHHINRFTIKISGRWMHKR